MKTDFTLKSNQKNCTGQIFTWDMSESPDFHPFFNVLIEGANIQSLAFSLPRKDMERMGVALLRMVKSKRLRK